MITSAVPYTGNKRKVWKHIEPHLSQGGDIFLDLFCGGGTVALNVNQTGLFDKIIANDKCHQIVEVLDELKSEKFVNRMVATNKLSGDTKADYLSLRKDYNKYLQPEMLLNLLYKSNSNMCRFSDNTGFNVPFGERNSINVTRLQAHREASQGIVYTSEDYHNIIAKVLTGGFAKQITVYFDPPYSKSCATYNTGWSDDDDVQMLNLIEHLMIQKVKVILSNVFTNRGKENKLLKQWCTKNKDLIDVHHLNEISYQNSSFRKSDKVTDEVLIVTK